MENLDALYYEMMQYKTYFRNKYPSIPMDDLEDELNWSFFKAYRNFDPSKGVQFKTYFFNIMNNGCKCILRYRDYRKDLLSAKSLDYIDDDNTYSDYYNYAFLTNNIDDAREISIDVLDTLSSFTTDLPQGQKSVIELYLKGYSNGEISDILNLQHNNVSTQKVSVLKKFIKQYKDEFPILRELKTSKNIINRLESK
jgi:RNA polymerase sigma factor (sigma-70 family)